MILFYETSSAFVSTRFGVLAATGDSGVVGPRRQPLGPFQRFVGAPLFLVQAGQGQRKVGRIQLQLQAFARCCSASSIRPSIDGNPYRYCGGGLVGTSPTSRFSRANSSCRNWAALRRLSAAPRETDSRGLVFGLFRQTFQQGRQVRARPRDLRLDVDRGSCKPAAQRRNSAELHTAVRV